MSAIDLNMDLQREPNSNGDRVDIVLIEKSLPYKTYGYVYEEIVLGKDASLISLKAITGLDTVPQIFIGGEFIGGEFIGDSEALSVYL